MQKWSCAGAYPEGAENYNDEGLGEAEEVSAFTYYPVDSSVLNNIVGSVQVRMLPFVAHFPLRGLCHSTSVHHQEVITDLLGANNEDELVVRNAIEEKVTPDKAHPGPKYKRFLGTLTKYANLTAQMLREWGIPKNFPTQPECWRHKITPKLWSVTGGEEIRHLFDYD